MSTEGTARHIPGLTLEQYHQRPEWSHSQMEVFRESPPLFHGTFISKVYPKKESNAFDDGNIIHTPLLGGSLGDVVEIIPTDVLSNKGKRMGNAWKAWEAAHPDKILRKQAECDFLGRMIDSVRAKEEAADILDSPGHFEHSIVYQDEATGLWLRARPDKVSLSYHGTKLAADVKSTKARTVKEFMKDAAKYGYHRQAAWYWDACVAIGIDITAFVFISVNKTPAHECHAIELDRDDIELGRSQNRELLHELAWRLDTNNFTSRDGDGIVVGNLPQWAYSQGA